MNRITNLIRQYAPQAKFMVVGGPDELVAGFERVLDSAEI